MLENLPYIEDVLTLKEILTNMGAEVAFPPGGAMRVDPSGISSYSVTFDMVSSLRASYYLLGAMLGRYGHAELAMPGGCVIGPRPIDQHIKGMRALGAEVVIEDGLVKARADKLVGGRDLF